MKMDDTFIQKANLLKCCVYTLLALADSSPTTDYGDGAVVQCSQKFSGKNPHHKLILLNGQWRWLNQKDAVAEQKDLLRKSGGLYSHVLGRDRE